MEIIKIIYTLLFYAYFCSSVKYTCIPTYDEWRVNTTWRADKKSTYRVKSWWKNGKMKIKYI